MNSDECPDNKEEGHVGTDAEIKTSERDVRTQGNAQGQNTIEDLKQKTITGLTV